jgi:MFS family permease
MFNIWAVSVAFLALFCAYNTLQGYVTTLFPAGLGNKSLSILYGSVAIFVFFGTPLVQVLGTRLAMFCGALCYVAYIASLIYFVPAVVLVMSAVIGFGAAVLWVALGVWITQNSTRITRGQNMGIFWSVFQISNILGPMATFIIFPHLNSDATLFAGFTVCGAIGVAMLLLLRPVQDQPESNDADEGTSASSSQVATNALRAYTKASCLGKLSWLGASVWGSVLASFRMIATFEMAALMPLVWFSGCELSFWSGAFPLLFPQNQVGLILTFVGIGEVVGGVSMGHLGDRLGRSAPALVGAVSYAVALGLSCWIQAAGGNINPVIADVPLIGYVAAVCFGLADSSFNTTCYAMVSQLYGHEDAENRATQTMQPQDVHQDLQHLIRGQQHDSAGIINSNAGESPMRKKTSFDEHPRREQASEETPILLANAEEAIAVLSLDSDRSAVAFTIFQLVQNMGSALWFWVCLKLPLSGTGSSYTQIYLQVAMLAVGIICFLMLDWTTCRRRRAVT